MRNTRERETKIKDRNQKHRLKLEPKTKDWKHKKYKIIISNQICELFWRRVEFVVFNFLHVFLCRLFLTEDTENTNSNSMTTDITDVTDITDITVAVSSRPAVTETPAAPHDDQTGTDDIFIINLLKQRIVKLSSSSRQCCL